MNKILYDINRLIFVCFSLVIIIVAKGSLVASQGEKVRGNVYCSSTQEKLYGATVELIAPNEKHAKKGYGVYTDSKGIFQLSKIKPGVYTIRVSYLGYKNYEEKIVITRGESKTLAIGMTIDPIMADAVVVTGLASKNTKSMADVAVGRVDATAFNNKNTYQDMTQLLSGKLAGVQIMTNSGNVGGGITFMVRGGGGLNGNGQPLIFVDGTRINNELLGSDVGGQYISTLSDISPDDIKYIEVLKGPVGAAMYGTSGSNGVILITTHNGNQGNDFFDATVKSTFGWNEQAHSYEDARILSAEAANSVFRRGPIADQILSFTGKKGLFSYYMSSSRREEEGIVPGNRFERKAMKLNFDVNPSEEFNIKTSTSFILNENTRPMNDNNISGWLANVVLMPDSWQFTDSAAIGKYVNINQGKRFLGSFDVHYMPNWVDDLFVRIRGGVDASDYTNNELYPTGYEYIGVVEGGQKLIKQKSFMKMNVDVSAEYQYYIGDDVKLSTAGGLQLFETITRGVDVRVQNFPSRHLSNIGSAKDYLGGEDYFSKYREAGIFIRQDITIKDYAFLIVALRNEYSSFIGPRSPDIFYPRLSGAFRLDKFFSLPNSINLLKLRGGYGQSGQLPGVLASDPLRWGDNQTSWGVGLTISNIGNPDIQPERIHEFEFGFDMELANKLGLEVTTFYNFAKHSILEFLNAPSTGLTITTVPKNVGAIHSWGLETLLNAHIFTTRNSALDMRFIFNYQDNEILSLGGLETLVSTYNEVGHHEGYPRSSFIDPVVTTIVYDENGYYKGFKMSEGKVFIGRAIPKYNGSISATLRLLKNFSINLFFESALGHYVSNVTRSFQVAYGNDKEYNELKLKLFGDDNTKAVDPSDPHYKEYAERYARLDPSVRSNFVEKADWINFKEVSLNIKLNDCIKRIFPNTPLENVNLSMSVRNLFLITNYSGPDPVVNTYGGTDSVSRGVDFLTLQNPRTFNFTLTMGI